jgi:hypothetical protein
MIQNTDKVDDLDTSNEPESKIDEKFGICFSSGIKIFDPNTTETLLQIRGDN